MSGGRRLTGGKAVREAAGDDNVANRQSHKQRRPAGAKYKDVT